MSEVTSVNGKTGAVVLKATEVEAVPTSEVGQPSGVASLDGSGKLPETQLPSSVVTSRLKELGELSGSVTPNIAEGNVFTLTPTGAVEVQNPTNATRTVETVEMRVKQPVGGGHTVTFPNAPALGEELPISTVANTESIVLLTTVNKGASWNVVGQAQGSTVVIDMCKLYGARPGNDITTILKEAITLLFALGGGTVYFSEPGIYHIEGAVKEGEALEYKYKGQILLPARTGAEGRVVIRFQGCVPAHRPLYVGGTEPSSKVPGVVLKTNATSGNIIDVIPAYESYIAKKPFSNIFAIAENLTVQLPNNPQCGGFNFKAARDAELNNVVMSVAAEKEGEPTYPTGTLPMLAMPQVANDGLCRLTNVWISGGPVGLNFSEHTQFDNVTVSWCAVALDCEGYGNPRHMAFLQTVTIQKCPTVLRAKNEGYGGGLLIGTLDLEMDSLTGEWAHNENVIEDAGSRLSGVLAIANRQQANKGLQGKYGGNPQLNLSNPEWGGVGSKSAYPFDNFVRTQDIAGQIGASGSSVKFVGYASSTLPV